MLDIINTHEFTALPPESQLLYIHIYTSADENDHNTDPRKHQRIIGAADNAFRPLISGCYIIPASGEGVVVVRSEDLRRRLLALPQERCEAAHSVKRRKYGKYEWVRLTDDEYARLESDLGKDDLTRCIDYVDNSAQTTGNKNKWKDWNLVIRKCHRERWGSTATEGKCQEQSFEFGDFLSAALRKGGESSELCQNRREA